MRVLLTASTFPLRPDDGLPRFVFDLAAALAAHCEVTALVPDAPGAPRSERWDGVAIERFRYFVPRRWQRLAYGHGIAGNMRASWLARLQAPPFVLAEAAAVRRLAARLRCDVVHSHWILPQGLAAALARGAASSWKHVVTLHGGDAYLLARLPGARPAARFIAGRSDALFAVSGNVRDQLDAALGRSSGAELLPMGVDTARFAAAAGPPPDAPDSPDGYLLYVGRLRAIKGVSQLLRALPRVRERHPGLGLVVVGGGEEEAALRREVETLGLVGTVTFAGPRPQREVASWLAGCRVAVVPSVERADGRAEGMPTVVLEALAAGARLVATATGGIPEVVRSGENGWLCPGGDPDALAEALLVALADPPDSPVPERARRSAERFSWARIAERYLETFARLS